MGLVRPWKAVGLQFGGSGDDNSVDRSLEAWEKLKYDSCLNFDEVLMRGEIPVLL